MSLSAFIAGTDTGVGKTFVACNLLQAFNRKGHSTLALKPVAAGAEWLDGQWKNDDGIALQASASVALRYEELNPLCFEHALSPHIAAEKAGYNLDFDALVSQCEQTLKRSADVKLVEGAGGWRVPVSDSHTMADLAKALNLPVVLVVGMRLGCINHACLTAEAIKADGLTLAGWVANCIDADMAALEENLFTLDSRIPAPRLATIPSLASADNLSAIAHIDIDKLKAAVTS
ncbi:MAG: dethiobiotin synthetase [Flavobacteriales bacterium]|jgi:dethiobiotin synthetase